MATDTHNQNQMGRNDKVILWTIIVVIIFAALAYVAYGTYLANNNAVPPYNTETGGGTVSNTTTNR